MVENEVWSIEKKLAVLTSFIIILVPTIGINYIQSGHPLLESAYLWPWLLLIRYQPQETVFATDMYNFVLPPASLFVFLPSLIILRYAYDQFKMNSQREIVAGKITGFALIQMFEIWVIYQSQELFVSEDYTLYFIPQLLIIVIQGYFGIKWYQQKVKRNLDRNNNSEKSTKQMDQKDSVV